LQLAAAWGVLCGFRLGVPLVRDLAQQPERTRELVAQALSIRLLLALVILAAAGWWSVHGDATARERWILMLLLSACVLQQVGLTFDDALQGHEAFRASAVASTLFGLTVSAGTIAGVLLGRPIAYAVASQLAGTLVQTALTWRAASRLAGGSLLRLGWSNRLAFTMLRLATGVAAAGQVAAWSGRVDLVFVRHRLTETQLGQYGVPYKVLDMCVAGAMVVFTAIAPMLARAKSEGAEPLQRRMEGVLRFGVLAFLPFALLLCLLAPQVMQIFKGLEYRPAWPALAVLVWLTPLVFVEAVLHWVLYLHDRPWCVVAAMAAGLAANVLVCRALVASWGLVGAASGRLAAEGITFLVSAVLVARLVRVSWLAVLARPAAMALAMAAAWWALGMAPWWLRALLSAAVYLLAGRLLRPLEPHEWAAILGVMRRRAPREEPPLKGC
ncbi:MAG: polysaccharide biosynthesis C-terminal domain-containing protein, partial [Armatimonadetes bacterium]|nr:polysaccharide biosynthesis C-terminal domain-containing protein [Armatimonadota bacterium]